MKNSLQWIVPICVVLLVATIGLWLREAERDEEGVQSIGAGTGATTGSAASNENQKRGTAHPIVVTANDVAPLSQDVAGTQGVVERSANAAPRRNACKSNEDRGTLVSEAVAQRTESQAGEYPEVRSIEPRSDGCPAVASALKQAATIFDINSTRAVWYGGPASLPTMPDAKRPLQPLLLADRLCSGVTPFDATTQPKFELIAITGHSQARIFLGEYWVSDGTIVSPLSESEYGAISRLLLGREAQGTGPGTNMTRAKFDENMAKHEFNHRAFEAERQRDRDEELHRAQQHLQNDCPG